MCKGMNHHGYYKRLIGFHDDSDLVQEMIRFPKLLIAAVNGEYTSAFQVSFTNPVCRSIHWLWNYDSCFM